MEPAPLESRRATIEDLGALEILWSQSGLPASELGRFLSEFHVVTDPDGQIWPGRLDLCRAALDIRHGLDGRVLRAGKQARFVLRRLKARFAR